MAKMNPEVKAKWLAALRSGEYQQSRERLKCADGFCCLGVASDLYIKEVGDARWVDDPYGGYEFAPDNQPLEGAVLPQVVMEWMGLNEVNPNVEVEITPDDEIMSAFGATYNTAVAELNDGGKTFLEIADIIEAQL